MSNIILLANQLEKVMAAKANNDKKAYEKEAEAYRNLALVNGVTEEAVKYILTGGADE